jgi:hypothetical protein
MLSISLVKKAIGIKSSKYTEEMCLIKVVLWKAAINVEVRIIIIKSIASFLFFLNMGMNPKQAKRDIGLEGSSPGVAFFVPADHFQLAFKLLNLVNK